MHMALLGSCTQEPDLSFHSAESRLFTIDPYDGNLTP